MCMHDRLYVSNHSTVHMHCFKMTDIRGKKLLISKGVSYCSSYICKAAEQFQNPKCHLGLIKHCF